MTRALVTNDDGIDAAGLHELARVAVAAGLDVTVAAPARQSSGASASIVAAEENGRIAVERRITASRDFARGTLAIRHNTSKRAGGSFGWLVLDMIEVSERTRCGCRPATICEIMPPIDAPTMCVRRMPSVSSRPTMSSALS